MDKRALICSLVGHVDHGKSSVLDYIRGGAIVASEAGGITQQIGASMIPKHVLCKVCGHLLEKMKMDVTIPGLLFIDTPGHAAFTSLRKRGGSLADIAIVVVDMNEGFKPQTFESIEILKANKTPFIIAANKIDLVCGWNTDQSVSLLANVQKQLPKVITKFEERLYTLVGTLHELGFPSERFDRVDDYTKQIAICPVSAVTGEGIAELLMVLCGLAKKFLDNNLGFDITGSAKGTIMEVKEEKNLGTVVDVILYDGVIRVNDMIVIGGMDEPFVTKVRALLEPKALSEMRDKKGKFTHKKEVTAACGVRIMAPDLDKAVAGMPILVAEKGKEEEVKEEIRKVIESAMIETNEDGIMLKADTIGALEALVTIFREKEIPIKHASIGRPTKSDVSMAESFGEKEEVHKVLIGFNIKMDDDVLILAKSKGVKVITSEVIYTLLDEYLKFKEESRKEMERGELDVLVRPCKIHLMPGYIFRQNNPAIVGVEIMVGKLRVKNPLMNEDGKHIAYVKSLQEEKDSVHEIGAGKQVALAMDKVTVGRQINEGDTLYTDIPEDDFKKLKALKNYLTKGEIEVIKEIASIKRETNPVWGVG